MKRTEELFQLIHSLDKHEKRHFKLSASTEKGEKQYMRMFDIIAHQTEYEEGEILRELKIGKNVLAFQKNYLQRLILSKIAALSSTKRTEVRNLLTQADILFNKAQYGLHLKLLKKAKQLAREYDLHSYLLEIAGMEHTLAWRNQNLRDAEVALEEKNENLILVGAEVQYHRLANKIITGLIKAGVARNEKEMQELKKLISDPLMRDEKKAITFRCKHWMFHTLSLYYSIAGNLEKQYLYAKKNLQLFLENPLKTEHTLQNYLFALHVMASACNVLKKYDQAKEYLEMMDKTSARAQSEREKTWIFFTFHENNLNYYNKTGKFSEGVAVAEKLIRELPLREATLDALQNIVLCFHIAKIYFGAGNFSKCIEVMNRIRQEEDALRGLPDMEVQFKLFYLIVHYEKGNEDLIPHLSRSLHRYLSSKQRLYKFENILLDYLGKRLFTSDSKKESLERFRQLKKELLPLGKDPFEKTHLEGFDHLAWIESKIENRSFADIVRKKAEE